MEAMIQVNALTKQYDRAKEAAVKGVDFSVREGDFFAFLGPNGAGKTTTISILTTTLNMTSGNVTIAVESAPGQGAAFTVRLPKI